jgi:hypothetical protein
MFAQVTVKEGSMSLGFKPGLSIEIANSNKKYVDNAWEKYIKDLYNGKSKENRKADEIFTDNVLIPTILPTNTVDLFFRSSGNKEDIGPVQVQMWIDLGGGFITQKDHPEKFDVAEKMLIDFKKKVEKEMVEIELKKQEKIFSGLEKDQRGLEKDKEGYERDITNAEERIRKAKENIIKNTADQETSKKKIEGQKKVVEEIKKKLNNM